MTGTMPRLIRYLTRYRATAGWTVLCLIGTAVLGLVTPTVIQKVIDTANEYGSLSVVGLYAAGVLVIALVSSVLAYGQRFLMASVVQSAIYDIRNDLYDHILHLPFSYHDRSRTGQLISRLTSDIEGITMFFSFGLSSMVTMALTFTGASVLLFLLSWEIGLLGLALVPPMLYVALRGSNTLGPSFLALRQQFGRITAQLQENFAGVRVVKAFARRDYEIQKFERELNEFLRRRMGIIRVFAIFMPSMEFLTNLGTLGILAYGGFAVVGGRLSLGELVASQAYLMMLAGPIRMIGWMVVMARRATASGERIFEVLDATRDISDRPDAYPLPPLEGSVEFRNVCFAYEEGAAVLKDINVKVLPGQSVALIGATGSGKTSVINMIPRFYDVTEGQVLIDGHDVRDVTLASLRSQIGTIFQEAVLFSGTIAENIAYGRPDAPMDDIIRAAKAAQAHDFVMEFPDGYDTVVGERGVTVSGGQRQRITIARALLLDARILIMDDSTSSVDVETEYLIQQALQAAMRGRTSFVIAHRLSTVRNAHRILVLESGKIVEEGDHETLLGLGGLYQRIYETQFADQEEMA